METENLRLNSEKIVDSYIDKSDWRHSENANQTYSLSGLLFHCAQTVMAHYALRHIYPKDIAQLHINGDIHLHDLGMSNTNYCVGHNLRTLLSEGLGGTHANSNPARHFSSALLQIVNYLGMAQHEHAGAQAFSSIDTYLSPFISYDNLDEKEVKQKLQEFLFNLNIPSRWGQQLLFSNLSLDWLPAPDLKNEYVVYDGKLQTDKYSDFLKEQQLFNSVLMELFYEGDRYGKPFSFPIPTINITKDFPWDSEETNLLMKLTSKYGIPYFQNFIGSNLNPSDVRSMCCHLRLDMTELRQKTGALFGSGENTGSIGVVDINLNRIGYLAKDDDEYFEQLDFLLEKCKRALEIKRKVVTQSLENNLLPLTKKYIGNFDTFFSTISLVGMNESMLNFMNKTMGDEEGIGFTLKVMDYVRKRLIVFQEETENMYNLEAAPAESSAFRMAKKDIELYPKIRMYNLEHGAEDPMLTNSTQLPVDYTDDVFEAMDLQDEIQTKYTGGTVFHIFSGESLSNTDSLKSLIQKVCNQYKMPYFTFTPTFSICPTHGYLVGEHYTCPKCNKKTEVYSRVVGYLRPISQFNKGKQAEFEDRKNYKI